MSLKRWRYVQHHVWGMGILLMVQKSSYITTVWMVLEPVVNNGIFTTNLNWWPPDFWTINSESTVSVSKTRSHFFNLNLTAWWHRVTRLLSGVIFVEGGDGLSAPFVDTVSTWHLSYIASASISNISRNICAVHIDMEEVIRSLPWICKETNILSPKQATAYGNSLGREKCPCLQRFGMFG